MTRPDRMPPIPDAAMTSRQRDAVADFERTRRGARIEGPFVPLLRSPELLRHVQRVGAYLRYRSAVPPRLREMVILIAARHWCQQFEWNIHAADAGAAGLSAAVVDAIADGRRPADMAGDESALHDFCLELLHNRRVSDATYAGALAHVGEPGVTDVVGLLGYYSLLAMAMNTARTSLREDMTPALARFPD